MEGASLIARTAQITAAALLFLSLVGPPAFAGPSDGDSAASFVEIYWQSSKSIPNPGVRDLVILDPDIARAEVSADSIQFFGIERGETVALGYRNDQPISIRVRVIPRPPITISPSLLRRRAEMAQGDVNSTFQLSDSLGVKTLSAVNGFNWSQLAGSDGHLNFTLETEDNDFSGGHAFNLRHGSLTYFNPRMQFQALDYVVSLTDNSTQHYLSPYTVSDSVELRGASLTWKRGENRYIVFGGTTIPFFYLTLGSTRDIGGFSFVRKQSDKLSWFSTTSYINTPTTFFSPTAQRQNDLMQTGGFTRSWNKGWSLAGTGGVSNHGGMGRGEINYISQNLVFFTAGSLSAPLFPLNQVFSLFSGTGSIKSGITLTTRHRFTEALYYQRTETQALTNVQQAGSSDYLTPSFSWKINPAQDVNLSYTYSRNSGGFATQTSTGNRVATSWRYQFTPRSANHAEFVVGSLQDTLQLNSEDQLSFRDDFVFPVKTGNMQFSFQQERRNPSLVQKLTSELNLLSPALQNLFLQDPVTFVQSNNLPPEVKALLDAQVPVSTGISVSGQFRPTNKLSVAPNFSVTHASSGIAASWTPFVGYALTYQATRTLQLNSGLSDIWVLNSSLTPQRTAIFYVGFHKSFSALPVASLLPSLHGRIIEGRVFRDNNLNGTFNVGEKGIARIRVKLENGDSTLTDEFGRYRFTVGPGEHRVSVPLDQFSGPVRLTTQNEAQVDLIRRRVGIADFGVVDFARLIGSVFNDLRLDGKRQPDARGLGDVHLILDNGKKPRTIVAESNGNFEIDDLAPGDYTLTVDTNTLPANYVVPVESFPVHVLPVSTVVKDIPARALRSIAGRVFLKIPNDKPGPASDGKTPLAHTPRPGKSAAAGGPGNRPAQEDSGADYKLVPVAGIQLSAGYGIVTSDKNGDFLLRDLPAGDLTISVVPLKPLPPGMSVPSGAVHMPPDPIQVQGATIVISNPDLLPFLLGKTAREVRQAALAPLPGSRSPD